MIGIDIVTEMGKENVAIASEMEAETGIEIGRESAGSLERETETGIEKERGIAIEMDIERGRGENMIVERGKGILETTEMTQDHLDAEGMKMKTLVEALE